MRRQRTDDRCHTAVPSPLSRSTVLKEWEGLLTKRLQKMQDFNTLQTRRLTLLTLDSDHLIEETDLCTGKQEDGKLGKGKLL